MNRYQQQILVPEIGAEGQDKLSSASVLIIGAGGLGVVVATYLASMGVGNIGICDFDKIEESNLHRQFCYSPNEVGHYKATVLADKLKLQNPTIVIEDFVLSIDESNIQTSGERYQLICDCTDQPNSRILINDYCQIRKVPLIHGAVSDWQGYVSVFHYKQNFGLHDLFDLTKYFTYQTCSIIGVNSAVCGLIGCYMVNETIKILLGLENVMEGKLLYFNTLNNVIRTIKLKKT